ncbi:hypothetical protein L0128_14550 [candidate division KSB1 bacterium]|nr:hypothetical protein [candidate division KSB1 bacterium]
MQQQKVRRWRWKRWLGIILLGVLSGNLGYYGFFVYQINQEYHQRYDISSPVALRKFPYPYQAALAIASDIDNTSTAEEFVKIQEFLNTKHQTEMGIGVGLEIGNSFYLYDRPDRDYFAYFTRQPLDRLIIQKFIAAGYLDCIHSWGEGCLRRQQAIQALDELARQQFKFEVWINHSYAPSNLRSWFPTNLGDNPGSPIYHADLTIPTGIKFVWTGSSTYVIGQVTPIHFQTFWNSGDPQHLFKSGLNIGRAWLKQWLSVYGWLDYKYALHARNDLILPVRLDDGQMVYEFMRYDNHPNGIGKGGNAIGVAYNLSPRLLKQLKAVQGYAIYYTHFGKNDTLNELIPAESRAVLRNLETVYRRGEIYVTTTSKLLKYYLHHRYLHWSVTANGTPTTIRIEWVDDPVFGRFVPTLADLQGITFYVPQASQTQIYLQDQLIPDLVRNPADTTGRESVTIPRTYLTYPDLSGLWPPPSSGQADSSQAAIQAPNASQF